MPVEWKLAAGIELGGIGSRRIEQADGDRQRVTAEAILDDLRDRPGVVLADQVGMGKTYVALAVAASVISSTRGRGGPVVIMVPSRLRRKWQREWEQFKHNCSSPGSLDWVRTEYAHTPTSFFRLRDDRGIRRCHLVFMTTGCFSLGLQDPWIKLAFIRLARRHTKLSPQLKRRIGRWAATLVRQVTARNLTNDVVEELMKHPVTQWKAILVRNGVMSECDEDPVPELLARYENRYRHRLDWRPLCEFVRTALPARNSPNIGRRIKAIRQQFNEICRSLYEEWLGDVPWKAPLLILDEAHHAKNDTTRLARLFREQSESEIALLGGKFRRMLFLTATPFQLGHHELIQVLRTFSAVLWMGERAPSGTIEEFQEKIKQLAEALDMNRLAGRHLDQLWGKITPEMIGEKSVYEWWQKVEADPQDAWERQLLEAVQHCRQTRLGAEKLLRPWVIRHNRSPNFPATNGDPARPRRESQVGKAIIDGALNGPEVGLSISNDAILPFLLSARAQGELANRSGARAFFAEGLSSSYEAFHHTRDARGNARDIDDDGLAVRAVSDPVTTESHVPTKWYESQVAALIPSRQAERRDRLQHPKVLATVNRAIDLWLDRKEKVLVFCVYRETARALYEHLREEVEERIIQLAGQKLGLDPLRQRGEIENRLERIARRLSEDGRPFSLEVRSILSEPFQDKRFAVLQATQQKLVEVLTAYFRSPSFIVRYLPLEDPDLRDAWELGEGRPEVLNRGREALRRCIREATDHSKQTIIARVYQFLEYAVEQAERAKTRVVLGTDEIADEAIDPLKELLDAVSIHARSRRRTDMDVDEEEEYEEDDGTYRVRPLVRMVFGDTPPATRDRLALAFNSPLFPEILVSSSVMGEGIDLHRFCRHVIHHDGFWNPSTLEQQTGRLDRIRSKAEICRLPIVVCQPFIAGGADEKMFRVLRDRERWFQVVMGQKFEFDEAQSEKMATRQALPAELAATLTFDLERWKHPDSATAQ